MGHFLLMRPRERLQYIYYDVREGRADINIAVAHLQSAGDHVEAEIELGNYKKTLFGKRKKK